MMRLPEWALKEDPPPAIKKERELYLSRSLLGVMSMLSALRLQAVREPHSTGTAAFALAVAFASVLAVSVTRSAALLLVALALELSVLALQGRAVILRVLKMSVAAAAISCFLMLPALLLGQTQTLFILPAKTFLTVTAARLLAEIFSWHELTSALRFFRVPSLLLLLLDTTLRSLVLLGDTAEEMLTALKLRSVGTNPHKLRSLGGILGTLFLKARAMSEEMEQAMRCRGG